MSDLSLFPLYTIHAFIPRIQANMSKNKGTSFEERKRKTNLPLR
jgi:hypothetical protein